MSRGESVVLVRAEDKPDPWRATLERAGFRVFFRPVLAYESFPPDPWPGPGTFDAVAVTSPRAVAAVAGRVPEGYRRLPWYAVGPGTAAELEHIGLSATAGDGPATGAALGERLVADGRTRVLFLAGNPRRPDLERTLRSAGATVETLEVYRSSVVVEDWAPIREDWAIFFSPRGVEALATPGALDPARTRVGAIGPTTAGSLRERGFRVSAEADTPTPEALLAGLLASSVRNRPPSPFEAQDAVLPTSPSSRFRP